MLDLGPPPLRPDESARLAARDHRSGPVVMYQEWKNLLFLHWKYPVEAIQRTLPEGLFVDTYQGDAYLGVVPFFMSGIRPRFLPAVRGISEFMELNLRTYVYDRNGVPGVWFYSLDASQWLAVKVARRFFHLPYFWAQMRAEVSATGEILYRSKRRSGEEGQDECVYDYTIGEALPTPEPSSLEFFLVERYRLFAAAKSRIWSGAVSHPPYPVHGSILKQGDDKLLKINGLKQTRRSPDHILSSPGVLVRIHPLQLVSEESK